MIDLHTHILYGLDDGARDRDMTLAMLRQAEQDGTTTMVATPHFVAGAAGYSPETLSRRFRDVLNLIQEQQIDLKLLLGQELFLDEYIVDALVDHQCCTLAGTAYVLLELPMAGIPRHTEKVLYQLQGFGYRPILAHPERNAGVLDNPGALLSLLEMGCLMQINSTSITGAHGRQIQQTARLLLSSQMAQLVASDCHSDGRRSPALSAACQRVTAWLGPDPAAALFITNPQAVLNNQAVPIGRPALVD